MAKTAKDWGGRWDSNPRRPESQSGALPTELRPPSSNQTSLFRRFPCLTARFGAPGRTRTCDPRLRRPMLYPAELRAQSGASSHQHGSRWSGQRDSNPRPSAPKADALPDCAMPRQKPPPLGPRIIRARFGSVNLKKRPEPGVANFSCGARLWCRRVYLPGPRPPVPVPHESRPSV
jgi:hypothetical protein